MPANVAGQLRVHARRWRSWCQLGQLSRTGVASFRRIGQGRCGDVGVAFAVCCRSEGTCLFDILVGVGWWKTSWDPYGAEDRDDIFERDLGVCAGFDECADVFDD